MISACPSLMVVADSLEGGMGAAVTSHCKLFAGEGWHVTLAAPCASESGLDEVRCIDLPVPESAFQMRAMVRTARRIRGLMREFRPDVTHAHGLRVYAAVLAGAHRAFLTLHGAGHNPRQSAVAEFVRAQSRNLVPLVTRGAFTVSPLDRGRWTTMLFPSPRLPALDDVASRTRDESPLFLFVGRLAPPKRPDVFVDALAILRDRVPGVRGVVLGDGPDRMALAERIRRTDAPVTLHGHADDLVDWYGRAWGVCLISDFEGLPFVVQEAMWAGRPVLTSRLPGVEWFAADAARYVSDALELAEGMRELCDPEVRDERGLAARRRVRSMLSHDSLYTSLAEVYRDAGGPDAGQERV